MAKPDLGTKRQCLSCSSKYYDLGKDPAVCPRCGTIYQPAVALRSRAEAKVVDDDEEVEVEIVVESTVEIGLGASIAALHT